MASRAFPSWLADPSQICYFILDFVQWSFKHSPTLLWLSVFLLHQLNLSPMAATLSSVGLMGYLYGASAISESLQPGYFAQTTMSQFISSTTLAWLCVLVSCGLSLTVAPATSLLLNPVFSTGLFLFCSLLQQLTTTDHETELLWLWSGYQLSYLALAQPVDAGLLTLLTLSFTQLARAIHGQINIEWKEKSFDPLRTLVNQFCRLFSGSLLDPIAGLYTAKIKPWLQLGGLGLNMLNSLLSMSIRPGTRPVYTAISWTVLLLSCFALANIMLSHGSALLLGVPVSLIGGLIQLAAECLELLARQWRYIQYCRSMVAPRNESEAEKNRRLDTLIRQKQSIRRKQLSNGVTILISCLSWMPFLAPLRIASMSTKQLLSMAGVGLGITTVNFFQDRFFQGFLALDSTSELKAQQRRAAEFDLDKFKLPKETLPNDKMRITTLSLWSDRLWTKLKTTGQMLFI